MSVANRVALDLGLVPAVTVWKTESPMVKFRKDDRSRRIWTLREEEIFATTLVELVARGWKSDNGFHAGYLQKIEDNIRKEFPNSDIKGTLHVTSKISAWKKSYNSMRGILSRTGADKHAKFMQMKFWPFWETWKSIFGKDQATGSMTEDIVDAAATALGEQPGLQDHSSGDDQRRTSTMKNGLGMEFLANLHAETNSRFEVIAARIGYEFDLGKVQREVFDKLSTIDKLTRAFKTKKKQSSSSTLYCLGEFDAHELTCLRGQLHLAHHHGKMLS
ncbi:hypothetical protein SASPL_123641 [Salvia splendens]|uniref:Myb/SANT-like domain-containing protein n=1 Tax=Salvia splendens TaxID=180675 RepID=A0A8X8ZTL7_SALSN|nr:hypothetical protein SASPL_123641 [Salvia splendens]